ncbi:helix-turn-helix domain-containing protein [Alkalicoccus chagannorensis]|uniref:helix-turn-helix domain-containing protein n=1 Tax=Alkalicoccus chagannorensis TaxID=427072 RepID=UPI00047D28DC|nr:helix-turn-helix transcriptional regulator [Alkalicoccus chagannorensis]
MSLGTSIRHKRTSLQLSQEYVAEQLDVSRQAVSKWETDASKPSTKNLVLLASLFDCEVHELTSPEESRQGQASLEEPSSNTKNAIRMHMAAVFGRVFLLVGAVGFLGVPGSDDMGGLPDWYSQVWWGAIFLIGCVLTWIGSWDYFHRTAGSKRIVWMDGLFVTAFLLYPVWPFDPGISTLLSLALGTVVLILMNLVFFLPAWRKTTPPA